MKLRIAAAHKMSIGQALMLLLVLRFAQGSRLVEQLDGHTGQHTVSKNSPRAQGDLASPDAKTLLDRCLADAACSASLTAAARQWLPSHPLRPAAGVQPAGDTNTGSSSSASSIQATANTPTAITGVSWSSRTEGRQQGDEGADGEETSLTLKGWAAAALLVEAVAGMYLPLLLQRLRSPQWWLSLLNCFSGGIFLAAGIIHLLPHCAEAQEALGPIGPNGGDYPLYLVLVVVGYCLVFYVERVLFDVHGEGHTHCQHSNVFSHSCYYEAISHRPHNHRSCGHAHTNHNHNHQGCCGGGGSGGEGAVEGTAHRGHDRSHSRSHRHKPLQGPPALLLGAPEGASGVEDPAALGLVGGGLLLTLGAQAGAAEGTGAGVVPSLADVLLVGAQQGRGQGQEPEEEEEEEDAESCHSHHTPRAVCVCVEEEEEEEAHNHHHHHHDHHGHDHHHDQQQQHHNHGHHNHHHNHQHHQLQDSLHVPLLAAEVTADAALPAVAPPAANGGAGGCSGGTSGDACSLASWQQQPHPQLLLPEPASCPYHLQHPATLHHQQPHQHHPHHRPGGAPHSNDSSLSSSSHHHLNHHHNHHSHQGNSNHSGSDQPQPHSHSHPLLLTHQRHHTIKPRFRFMHGVVLLLALALHTSLECIALGLLQQRRQFLLLLAAIASHKAVSALALSSRFLKEGATMKQVTIYVGPFCLVAPLSILAGVYVGRVAPLASLVFSCFATGTFLYVGASEVIMEEFEGEMRADRRDISTAAARYIKFGAVLAAVALVAASGLLPEPEGHH